MSGRMMFYGDPSFRASSIWVTLKEDPDLQWLQEAVDAAVRLHPWAAYGMREADGMFYYSEHLPDSIRIAPWEDADPPALGGADAQGHLLGVFYQSRRLYFSFFHGLTDGTGIISFVDTCLRCYRALRDGEHFEQERQDYADAEAEPLTRVSQALQEAGISDDAQAGGGKALPQMDYADHGQMLSSGSEPCRFLIRADADDMMRFVKDMGVMVSTGLVALYASAFLKVHPEIAGSLRVALPVDYRKVLGIPIRSGTARCRRPCLI